MHIYKRVSLIPNRKLRLRVEKKLPQYHKTSPLLYEQ